MDASIDRLLEESFAHERAGRIAEAYQAAQDAFANACASQDREGLCQSIAQSAWLLFRMGQQDEASRRATEALAYAGDNPGTVRALVILGICAAQMCDLRQAEELFRRSIDLSRQIGFGRGLAMGLHNLGYLIYFPRGQFNLALETLREVHEIAENVGFPVWGYTMLRAQIHQMTGERDKARQALADLEAISHLGWTPKACYGIFGARLALDEDDLGKADELLRQARVVADPVGHPQVAAWIRITLSRMYRMKNDAPAARAWADEALATIRHSNYRPLEGQVLTERAQANWVGGDLPAAEADLRSAIDVLVPFDAAYDIANASFLLAALYQKQQRPEADNAWLNAAHRITQGGYEFILQRERALAFPLISYYTRSSNAEVQSATSRLLELVARVSPLPLHIVGLGRFHVRQGNAIIPDRTWERRKAGQLFRFLVLQTNHSAPRESILESLWPEHFQASAERLFHQATFTLRHILEPDLPDRFPSRYVSVENECVAIDLPSGSTVDFENYEQALGRALVSMDCDMLERALALYQGELYPPDCYADWATGAREHLAELEIRGMVALARLKLAANVPQAALDLSRRILQREPWLEDAVLIGMRACIAMNDRPNALLLYRSLENALRQELGILPRQDLRDLATLLTQ